MCPFHRTDAAGCPLPIQAGANAYLTRWFALGAVAVCLAAAFAPGNAEASEYFEYHELRGAGGKTEIVLPAATAVRGSWTYDLKTKATNPGIVASDALKNMEIVPIGGPSVGPRNIGSLAASSWAYASADYGTSAVPGPGGTKYSGFTDVYGVADPEPKYVGTASSSAFSQFLLEGWVPFGQIGGQWVVRMGAKATGNTKGTAHGGGFVKGRDPLAFSIQNLVTGEVISETVIDIPWAVDEGGAIDWADGNFSLNARNASFEIRLGGAHVLEAGLLKLEIANGTVSTAIASGAFAGWLDGIPATGPINIPMPTALDFTLDFASLSNPDEWTGDLSLHVEAEAFGAVVPEPEVYALMLVGLGIVGRLARRRQEAAGA